MRALGNQATTAIRAYREEEIPSQTSSAAGCPMGALERKVMAQVDGQATIGEITARLDLTVIEVSHVIRRLAELGAIAMTSAVEATFDEGWDHPSVTIPPATAKGSPE
ncbi:MAG: hypothetical protein ACXWUG_06805 [Polyangiales bacterium]